jgi:hypothetical protein
VSPATMAKEATAAIAAVIRLDIRYLPVCSDVQRQSD